MHIEVEKLDYKLERLMSVYDSVDAAISSLELVQLQPVFVDTSDILSSLLEKRVLLSSLIWETRQDLFNAYRKYHGSSN